MSRREPRVVIVSDPLLQSGGAERAVADGLALVFPAAPIFALRYSVQTAPATIAGRARESWVGDLPGASKRHRYLVPLFLASAERFDLADFDIIVSSHHTFAKGILRRPDQLHVCYCHTPRRALWERPGAELAALPSSERPKAGTILRELRNDYVAAARVDAFVANSETTRRRISAHYGRESVVIYPPIETGTFRPGPWPAGDYYLYASRLAPSKRADIAIEATARAGRTLICVGAAPLAAKRRGFSHVDFQGHVSDQRLAELMRGARALIFPALEDFGMAPLQAMACGTPTIAFGEGGACETIADGVTGILVKEQNAEAFSEAIARFESSNFDRATLRAAAMPYSRERFVTEFSDYVSALWAASSPPARPRSPDRASASGGALR